MNDGVCIKDGEDFKCDCVNGWSGKKCEVEPDAFDWTILIVILVVLLVLVFVVLAILVCVCCVMRNREEPTKTAAKPQPATVKTRELIIPPPQVKVIQVEKGQMPSQALVPTKAMFVSSNPQKTYSIRDPLEYKYPQNIYSQPKKPVPISAAAPNSGGTVRYVAGLAPAGTYQVS